MAKLNPLIIPSIDYIGNPGLGYYDLYDTESKPVALSALMHEAVKETDYVELLLGPAPFDEASARVVDEYYINTDHLSAGILSFTVSSLLIADSPPNAAFFYRSYSGPFENESSSDPRSVLVKRPIPGNPTIGAVYVNDNLAAPAGVPTSIEEVQPQTLTIAPWGNMAAGDVLTLFWGGNRFKVSNPPLSAGQVGAAQTIVVPALLIGQAGDSDSLQVNYEIRDTVNNWSLYSKPAFVGVYVDPNAPGAPIVLRATHEGSLYSLDLASLAGANVQVMVPRSLPLIVGDTLTLTWEGQNADGTPITTPIAAVLVTDENFVDNFVVPYDYVAAIASGSARVFYRVTHNGATGARSKSITVNIIGEVQKLAAPQIKEAVDSELDPAATPVNATLIIPAYSGMDAGHQIIVTWAGYPQVGPPQTYLIDDIWLNNSDKGNNVERLVDTQWVTAFAGGKLEVSYQVNTFSTQSSYATSSGIQTLSAGRSGDAVRPGLVAISEHLKHPSMLGVGAELKAGLPLSSEVLRLDIVGEVILLTPPTVDSQADGFLDPVLVPNGTTVRIPNYLGKGQGETLNLYWDGVPGAGTTEDSTIVRSAGQPVNFPVGTAHITPNLDRSVDVWYETVLAGKTARSESLVFSVQRAQVQPIILKVTDSKGAIANGGTTTDASLTFEGTAKPGTTVELYDGNVWLGTAQVLADTTWSKELSAFSLGLHGITARTADGALVSLAWAFTLEILNLLKPTISPLIGDILDLASLTGTAMLKIPSWSPIAAGQRIWIYCEGRANDGTAYSLPVRVNAEITAAEVTSGVIEHLAASQLAQFLHGTTLTVRAKVLLRADEQESQASAFPLLEIRINKVAWLDTVETFSGGGRGNWTWGPATATGRIVTSASKGYAFYQISEPGNQYAGVVFEKTFSLPLMDYQYSIGFQFLNIVPVNADAQAVAPKFRILIKSSGQQSAIFTSTRGSAWQAANFITNNNFGKVLTVQIISLEAGSAGNDYGLTQLSVTRI